MRSLQSQLKSIRVEVFRVHAVCTVLFLVQSWTSLSPIGLAQETIRSAKNFRIAVYLPDYRADDFHPEQLSGVTDLILFSGEPTNDGQLHCARLARLPWREMLEWKTQQRTRLILALGGWERSENFLAVAQNPKLAEAFSQQVVRYCLDKRLDGVDMDWEHPKSEIENQAYQELMHHLRAAMLPHGLTMSMTVPGWQEITEATFKEADWVQVMAYDHEGKHATLESARDDLAALVKRGAPKEKLVLGIPFYGRSTDGKGQTMTYAEILEKFQPAEEVDEVDGFFFNGQKMVQRKVELAKEAECAGVMIWEIGQDVTGNRSLLKTIVESAAQSVLPH